MGKVINILGPHGVGKTCLQKYILSIKRADVFEGFIVPTDNFDLANKNEFFDYEKEYAFKIQIQNSKILKSKKDGFIIRSIEEVRFFLETSKFTYSNDEIDNFLKSFISSDILIYLDASIDTLQKRIKNDKNRDMEETVNWYEQSYKIYDSYFKKIPGIIIIDTNSKTPDQILLEIYEKIGFING